MLIREIGICVPRPYLLRMAATTLSDRAILRLSGDDVGGFLQGLVTHDMALLAPGRPLWAGLLTPQGKALFDFILWADGGDVLVDCEAEAAEDLMRRLTLYRLRRKIGIKKDESLAVHWRPCALETACAPSEAGAQPTSSPAKAGVQSGADSGPRPSPGSKEVPDPRL